MNIKNYEEFLDFIMPAIDKKFEHQKEYIACSKGCALCCKTVSMPFSDLEFEYMKFGYSQLNEDTKNTVRTNIKKIKSDESQTCPFLINNVCSIYKYRGLICRTFGLLLINEEDEYTIPFCVHKNLNYSKVFDEKTQKISPEKIKEQTYTNPPMFYTLSRTQIFDLKLAKDLGLIPKNSKPLKEWIMETDI